MKGLICYLLIILFCSWGIWYLIGNTEQAKAEKEQCIILKHERKAEEFITLECYRHTQYNQKTE